MLLSPAFELQLLHLDNLFIILISSLFVFDHVLFCKNNNNIILKLKSFGASLHFQFIQQLSKEKIELYESVVQP